jgi:prolyl 4-hydroxylase
MATLTPLQQAMILARDGRAEAVPMLERLAAEGEAGASFALGLLRLEGRLVARDLGEARAAFERAARAGHREAARASAALLAGGTGGARDRPGALAVLRDWAPRDPIAGRQLGLIGDMELTPDGDPAAVPPGERLADRPEVIRIPGLLSDEECRFLIDAAEARLRPALIFHEGRQSFVRDPLRDSDAAGFPAWAEWPAVHALNRRFAAASGSDVRQGEPLQILRYREGQQYRPHHDAVPGLANQRILTLIVYLNAGYEGGETLFTRTGLAVKGRRGDALLFRNALPDGRPDPDAQHAGRPVRGGEKLIASRWIRQRPPDRPDQGFGPEEAAPR